MRHILHPIKPLLLAAVSLLIAVSAMAGAAVPAKLVGVADGDTVTVVMDGQQTKIRLYGIDAPEKAQPYGQSSTESIKQLTTGKTITVQSYERDKYGRTVGVVFADGVNINEAQVKAGNAWVYQQYCKEAFCAQWKAFEKEAKTAGVGLWKDASPTAPWEWRHGGAVDKADPQQPDMEHGVIGNVQSRKFHSPTCRHAGCKNCTATFNSREQAIASGYVPCKVCNP